MNTIPLFKVFMSEDVNAPMLKTLHSGFTGQGPRCDEFEDELRHFFSHGLLTTVNSGTSALQLALHCIKEPRGSWPGVQPGDEVLVSPITCFATITAILNEGLVPKWVDADLCSCNMDMEDLSRKITKKTKVIMPVHWGGNPHDFDELERIQGEAAAMFGFKPVIIEDAAHAFGATWRTKKIGTLGHITCFSFQSIKHLSTGDGGLVLWPHDELYKQAKLLRWFGLDREDKNKTSFRCDQDIFKSGFKYHMNDIAATIGLANLPEIPRILSQHQNNAEFLNTNITNHRVRHMWRTAGSVDWIYTIAVDDRSKFMEEMKYHGVMTSQVHDRCDKHPCVRQYRTLLPNVDVLSKEMVSIPCGWWLEKEDLDKIVSVINEGW